MPHRNHTLVAIATFNEIENLPQLVDAVLGAAPDVTILVVDDNSPDGTGQWCDTRTSTDSRVRCLHRSGKFGLGSATIAAFRYALEHGFEYVVTMDADFSHPPRYLPALRAGVEGQSGADVMIGSRYVPGGGIEGWPLHRRIMSRAVNAYARWMLGLPVKDCSGAFRCYRTEILQRIPLDRMRSQGYSYLEEVLWLLKQAGARFAETPIVFVDRQRGQTKINLGEAVTAILIILQLGLRSR